jgi:RNA recognition motif-containing protein
MQTATDVRLLLKAEGQSKGCAYVQFATASDAKAALVHDQELYHGKHILVAPSAPPDHSRRGKQGKQRKEAGRPPASSSAPKFDGRKGHKADRTVGGSSTEPLGPSRHPHQQLGGAVMASHKARAKEPPPKAGMDNAAFKEMLGL